jgi:HTH-type transcriptional regulator/antitoxin HigA
MADCIPCKTAERHAVALAELEGLMMLDRPMSFAEQDRLEILAVCVSHYERRHFPYRLPSAVDAVRFRMEQGGHSEKDVGKHVGGPARLRKILDGTVQMNVNDVRAFHNVFGVPLTSLIFGGEDSRWHYG